MPDYSVRTALILCCAALLASASAACSRATAAAADGETFRGVYEMGPDRSAFLPCGSDEQWFVLTGSTAARELRRLTGVQDVQAPGGGLATRVHAGDIRRAYVEVRGDTVPSPSRNTPRYERELQLSKVLLVQPAQGGVCP
jgi:hypothetical protein